MRWCQANTIQTYFRQASRNHGNWQDNSALVQIHSKSPSTIMSLLRHQIAISSLSARKGVCTARNIYIYIFQFVCCWHLGIESISVIMYIHGNWWWSQNQSIFLSLSLFLSYIRLNPNSIWTRTDTARDPEPIWNRFSRSLLALSIMCVDSESRVNIPKPIIYITLLRRGRTTVTPTLEFAHHLSSYVSDQGVVGQRTTRIYTYKYVFTNKTKCVLGFKSETVLL